MLLCWYSALTYIIKSAIVHMQIKLGQENG